MRFGGEDEVSGDDGEGSREESNESEGEEEEEWGGVNGANGAVHDAEDGKHTGTKPKKPPTGEELRNIKDATDLYRSSSFKLQVRHFALWPEFALTRVIDRRAPPERPSEIHKIRTSGTLPPRAAHIPQLPLPDRAQPPLGCCAQSAKEGHHRPLPRARTYRRHELEGCLRETCRHCDRRKLGHKAECEGAG